MKRLSIALPASVQLSSPPDRPRRLSVVSLPTANPSLLHRREEEPSPTVPYIDGPIQIIPGIWLGSEDNARDWKGLVERRIRSILNVAKEVVSPFDSAHPLRPFASTPNLKGPARPSDSTYYPPHLPSGRPSMHYLKLQWSHGQQDLVQFGFPEAMAFTDAALARGEGVLVHCQCGISRSATLVIALLMRAAARSSPSVPPEISALKGMQASYAYVKEKSKWIGPNMSLIYQLLEYERTLNADQNYSPSSGKSSLALDDEEEWGRRRSLLDDPASDQEHDDKESVVVMREAQALDKAMEDRIIARKSSGSSIASSSRIGMGAAWRSRYGVRKRTGSIASNTTSGSIISEDLVEEEEEQELLGVGGGFDDHSIRHKSSSERDGSSVTNSPDSPTQEDASFVLPIPTPKFAPQLAVPRTSQARLPPSAPVWKTSFDLPQPPATAFKSTFDLPLQSPAVPQGKRRPAPLGITPSSFSSTITIEATPVPPSLPRRLRTESRKSLPPPLHFRKGPKTSVTAAVTTAPTTTSPQPTTVSTPSQTLFVFPPSPTLSTRTPSIMTLTSNMHGPVPFPTTNTPRVSTFRAGGRTKSFIGLGVPPTPTTACSRVDARGWIGLDASSAN